MEFYPEASIPNYVISWREIPEPPFTPHVWSTGCAGPWLSRSFKGAENWKLLLCGHVREGVAACAWAMSCGVSALCHWAPSSSAGVHHFLPRTWLRSPEPLFSHVRGHKVFIISAERARTGPPRAPPSLPLLPRWSALCHNPNRAGYWLLLEQLGNNWKQHISLLLTFTAYDVIIAPGVNLPVKINGGIVSSYVSWKGETSLKTEKTHKQKEKPNRRIFYLSNSLNWKNNNRY